MITRNQAICVLYQESLDINGLSAAEHVADVLNRIIALQLHDERFEKYAR
jgi:hypothetical protein